MRVRVGWWNTSLAPGGKATEASDQARMVVLDVLKLLVHEHDVQMIGLGEVSAKDMAFIASGLGGGYTCHVFNEPFGRVSFDLGFLVKTSVINNLQFSYKVHYEDKRTFALAVELKLQVGEDGHPLTIFFSHWPSRLHMAEDNPNRFVYGYELRKIIQAATNNDNDTPVILAGDYNDEPFSKSLAFCLKATRDRVRAVRNPSFFYNPFWRKLGAHLPHNGKAPINWAAGTYYYSNGKETKWHTFDQFMFSTSFLKEGSWYLIEDEGGIVIPPDFLKIVRSRKNRFDHLPIISAIERDDHV